MKIKVINLDEFDLEYGAINIGDEFEVYYKRKIGYIVKLIEPETNYFLFNEQCEITRR